MSDLFVRMGQKWTLIGRGCSLTALRHSLAILCVCFGKSSKNVEQSWNVHGSENRFSFSCARFLCMHKTLVHAQDSCACTRNAQESCACTRFLCMHKICCPLNFMNLTYLSVIKSVWRLQFQHLQLNRLYLKIYLPQKATFLHLIAVLEKARGQKIN